jgi:ABC-type branched-subunit amino acid transport system ATPase component
LTEAAALQVEGLSSGYGAALVVRGLSLDVAPGEIVAVLGKNGMGKTTLLRTVMGYLHARTGHVRMFGTDMHDRPVHARSRAGVGYIPQEQALFQDLPVRDNLRLGLADDRQMQGALTRIGALFPFLPARLPQKAGTLSGGEQKMLLLARALMGAPRLLLIDEVTEGLQPSNIDRIAELLRAEAQEQGRAILLVEQHVGFALRIAHRYAVLKGGEKVAQGAAADPGAAADIAAHLQL